MAAPIVVVGAGQAAASFISRHIALGSEHNVLLLGEESHLPYQRPPLSKKYLLGQLEPERLLIRPPHWYVEQGVEVRLQTRVGAIDRQRKQLTTATGETISYEKLVLCTGSSARPLPKQVGGALDGVFTLRSIADIDVMSPQFQGGSRLAIVGGGYIGLEAAAVARQLGLEVTLLEMTERILQRVAAAETSNFFRQLHQQHGVVLHESTRLTKLHACDHQVCAVELENGASIDTDLVLVGIGASPNVELAQAAGLECANGIRVDACCRSSDPDIYAAGDCCNFDYYGVATRLESVQNAADQGDLVARVLAGETVNYRPLPWFWSDQYDCKLQIAGLNQGHNHTVTRPGSTATSLSVWYFRDTELLAVDAMNEPKSYAYGRKMLATGINPSPQQLTDPTTNLKALAQP